MFAIPGVLGVDSDGFDGLRSLGLEAFGSQCAVLTARTLIDPWGCGVSQIGDACRVVTEIEFGSCGAGVCVIFWVMRPVGDTERIFTPRLVLGFSEEVIVFDHSRDTLIF